MHGFLEKVIQFLPKLSDEQVKRVLLEVSNEHQLLLSLIDSLPTGIIIVSKDWKIRQLNKFAERTVFSSVMDDSKYDAEPVWAYISEPEIRDFLKNACENNLSNIVEEFSVSDRNSSVKFLVVSVMPFISEKVLSGSIIKIEDITQKRKKEIFQRRMEHMNGLTTLAAEMAHEIKNPLAAISIHIQLIQKAVQKKRNSDGKLPDKKFLEEHLEIVNQEVDVLNKLVMDFLFAVRPVKPNLSLIDPSSVIEDIIKFCKPEFEKNSVDFSFIPSEKRQRILIDEKLFRDVVMNITGNALHAVKSKFSENSESNLKTNEKALIEISNNYIDENYVLKISDNGCGMDEETLSKVFEPYFTTKASGTGLGLTMSYKIIKEFNGDISVESEKGKGTIFTIKIPVPQSEIKLLN